MEILKYVIVFVIFFLLAYIVYYIVVTNGQIKSIRGKSKKKKNLSAELLFLKKYYDINLEKVGVIKVLRLINFVNAFIISTLVTSVAFLDKVWLKLLIIVVLLVPLIWASYYFLAKYLKHSERKKENV